MSSCQMQINVSKPSLLSSQLLPSCFAGTVNNSTIPLFHKPFNTGIIFSSSPLAKLHTPKHMLNVNPTACPKISLQQSFEISIKYHRLSEWNGFTSHRKHYLNLTDEKTKILSPAKQVVFACSYQILVFWFSTHRHRKVGMIHNAK